MGVGRPDRFAGSDRRGVDLFDCVMPTRNGRNALAFTDAGPVRLRNQQHALDREPLEPRLPVRPAGTAGGICVIVSGRRNAGADAVSMHNLTYYQQVVAEARRAIAEDRLAEPGRGASPRLGAGGLA